MKKFLLATLCILIGVLAFAQAPQKMSYQAVIRDNSGNLVTNQQISMRISILKETELSSAEYPGGRTRAFGDEVTYIQNPTYNQEIYIETHTVSTNTNGLVSIEIGTGTVSMGNFSSIDWSEGLYFIKTDVDLNGGTRFKTIGTSQLISVPYAMYAQKAGSAVTETDPQFNAWDKDYNDLTNRPEIPVVPTNVSAFENDANYLTSYTETDPQFNAWDKDYNDLTNRPEIPVVPTNVSAFENDANYLTSYTETDPQFNAWDKDYNDLTNRPEIPVVPTNVSAFTNDANYITSADVPTQVNADWNATSGAGQILNKPELFSGNYNDLTNKPAIPTVPTNVSAFTNDANYITSADVPAQVNADWNATSGAGQILNKPELFSGNYNDLTNRPEIPTVPTNVSAFTNDANYITSADVPAQVNADWNATSGAGQILNKPEIPTVPTNVSAFANDANYITSADVPAQVNADWNATSGAGQILNKPEIPTVPTNVSAFTNDAQYITSADVPAQVNADWNATSGAGHILNKPELFSGNYNDLANRPEIPVVPTNVSAFTNDANYITSADVPAQVNADWNATSGAGQILNKPEIPTVPTNVSAFTNDANYITSADVPAQVNSDWNATSGAGQILNKPEIPTVPTNVSAFDNDRGYITSASIPTNISAFTNDRGYVTAASIPTNVSAFTNDRGYITSADVPAQVNADWNATSGAGQILNKPAIPTVPTNVSAFTNDANYITSADVPAQVNADWNATSGAGQILNKPELFSGNYNDLTNKPTIPTVPTNVSAFTNDANYITSADVPAQVNADWNATSGAGQILNKPELFDGNYNNLTNTPDLSSYITDETQTLTDVVALSNSAGDRQIKNVADPTENQDAVTKKYVDELIAALQAQNAALQAQIAEMQATIDTLSVAQGGSNITYTVTFNANGGTGTMNPQTFSAGIAQALTANTFTRENYNFAGWNTSADGNGTAYTDSQEITATTDMTLYAQWEIITYTVTFESNGGTGEMSPQVFNAGEEQAITSNSFTKSGYVFCGWYTTDRVAYSDGQSIVATSDMILYARWFSTEGNGTLEGYSYVDLGLPSGTKWATHNVGASNPEDYGNYYAWGETSTKTTYSFNPYLHGRSSALTKYCNDPNYGNNGFSDSLTILEASDDAATANWGAGWKMPSKEEFDELKNNCTYVLDTLNGVNGCLFSGPNGNTIFLPAAGFRNDDLRDAGVRGYYWSNSLDTSNPNNAWNLFINRSCITSSWIRYPGCSIRPICSSNDIGSGSSNPQQSTSYTVTFNANGGTGTMEPQTFNAGEAQALTTNTFSKENYNFAGWNTAANGSGTAYTDGQSVTISADMTLYAQWTPITYTVTFDSNGGTGTMNSQTFTAGVAQALKRNSFGHNVDEYCTSVSFTGWNTKANGKGTSYTNQQSIIVTRNMTLYAQWRCASTWDW